MVLFTLSACSPQLPEGKMRLERNTYVEVPSSFTVLKEEFQDMLQDYGVLYDIKVTRKNVQELVKNIKACGYYDPDVYVDASQTWHGNLYGRCNEFEGAWVRYLSGYRFYRNDHGTSISASYDTTTGILKYQELGD